MYFSFVVTRCDLLIVAVDKLPNFLASPTPSDKPGPHHQCSIHLNCESVELLETAYKEAVNGRPSARYTYLHTEQMTLFINQIIPAGEMTIPRDSPGDKHPHCNV